MHGANDAFRPLVATGMILDKGYMRTANVGVDEGWVSCAAFDWVKVRACM